MLIALAACAPDVRYSHYRHIKSQGWQRADTARFHCDTIRTSGAYNIVCGVRTTREYPYQELALIVENRLIRKGKTLKTKKERVIFPVVTPSGKTLGSGTASKQHEAAVAALSLLAGDSLDVSIHHIMSQDTIQGIIDVGITVEKQ